MAENFKSAQVAPGATTLTTAYTCPPNAKAIVRSATVCNRGSATTFRIAKRVQGASIDNSHYYVYDDAIGANKRDMDIPTMVLNASDIISVYAGTADMTFNFDILEITNS